jgi:hypothetical protein
MVACVHHVGGFDAYFSLVCWSSNFAILVLQLNLMALISDEDSFYTSKFALQPHQLLALESTHHFDCEVQPPGRRTISFLFVENRLKQKKEEKSAHGLGDDISQWGLIFR